MESVDDIQKMWQIQVEKKQERWGDIKTVCQG